MLDWLRSRTPDGRWFDIRWDKQPTIDDIDHMLKVLAVAREGYVPKKPLLGVGGVRVIRVASPYEIWRAA